jgi:hypothetical protein
LLLEDILTKSLKWSLHQWWFQHHMNKVNYTSSHSSRPLENAKLFLDLHQAPLQDVILTSFDPILSPNLKG